MLFFLDLQNVNITLRILFRPIAESLPNIFKNLGVDYDERVLPSVVNEVLKAVVVCFLLNNSESCSKVMPAIFQGFPLAVETREVFQLRNCEILAKSLGYTSKFR